MIFVTQLIDADDPVLGFVVPQIRTLAARAEVIVIANEVRQVPTGFGAEVFSLGKEKGRGQAARGARYVATMNRVLRRSRPSAILAHMCPIYLTLAAPLARTYRVPTMLWFIHPDDSFSLHVAERLADVVITAFPGSYPRPASKVVPIGHAIDTESLAWAPSQPRDSAPLRLLALGRTSPVKGYDVMIRALEIARRTGARAELRIVGPSVTPSEHRHRAELRSLAEHLPPGTVRIDEGISRGDVAAVLRGADVVLNATEAGSADKVVFEAMAVGRPVVASSPAFDPLLHDAPLPLQFPDGDADALAQCISTLASAPAAEIDRVGRALRQRIEREHSLEHWVTEVVALAGELSTRRKLSRSTRGTERMV